MSIDSTPRRPDGLRLSSRDLFTPDGFGRGFTPEAFLDVLDEAGLRYPSDATYRRILADLVFEQLLPLIPVSVECRRFDAISRNPVRAVAVEGQPVNTAVPSEAIQAHVFNEVVVEVSWDEVLTRLIEHANPGTRRA